MTEKLKTLLNNAPLIVPGTKHVTDERIKIHRNSLPMRIEVDDLSRPQVLELLNEHLSNMHELSPADQVFALDVSKLKAPEITFWTVWEGDVLLGCGALKELDPKHGEIKSMRTPKALRRRGAGRKVLAHIIEVATNRGYEVLSLETGSSQEFLPAHRLYESFGFKYCGPFGDYVENGNSTFMSLLLQAQRDILIW